MYHSVIERLKERFKTMKVHSLCKCYLAKYWTYDRATEIWHYQKAIVSKAEAISYINFPDSEIFKLDAIEYLDNIAKKDMHEREEIQK